MDETPAEVTDIGGRVKQRARRQEELAKLREQRMELMKSKREAIKASFVAKRRKNDQAVRATPPSARPKGL